MSPKKTKKKVARSKKKITRKTTRKPATKRGHTTKRTKVSASSKKRVVKKSASRANDDYYKKLQTFWEPEFWLPTVFGVATIIIFLLWMKGEYTPKNTDLSSSSRQSYGRYFASIGAGNFLNDEFDKASKLSFQSRISFWSRKVQKNKRYFKAQWEQASAPSTPKIKDKAPLIPKSFNCTTFVETVAALAKSKDASEFYDHLISIRYKKGRATYGSRNHFPSSDWIPNNVHAGNLKDITKKVAKKAGVDFEFESKTLKKQRWVNKQMEKGRISRGLATFVKSYWDESKKVKLPYIALDEFKKVSKHIPHGSVLNIVRENEDKYDVLISHQGFVIHSNGKTYFRHSSVNGRVRTVTLDNYLKNQKLKSWKIVGFNLNQFK